MSNENDAKKPPRIEMAKPGQTMCNCVTRTGVSYGCTRPKGHTGDHVAHGHLGEIYAMWSPDLPAHLHDLLLKAQDLAEAMRKHNLTHLGQLQLR